MMTSSRGRTMTSRASSSHATIAGDSCKDRREGSARGRSSTVRRTSKRRRERRRWRDVSTPRSGTRARSRPVRCCRHCFEDRTSLLPPGARWSSQNQPRRAAPVNFLKMLILYWLIVKSYIYKSLNGRQKSFSSNNSLINVFIKNIKILLLFYRWR